MNFLIFPLGTRGDVNPMLRIGARLLKMGHTVTVISLDYFEDAVREAGLEFEILVRDDFYRDQLLNPKLWHPTKGFELLMRMTMKLIPPVYNRIGESLGNRDTAVVAGPLVIGARMAWDKWDFPLFTVCLQPVVFGGVEKMPRFSGLPGAARMPRFIRKTIYKAMDIVADYHCCPPVNAFRHEAAIHPPVRQFLTWWLTPQPVLGLFPDWFGPPQPDWLADVRLTGFPLEAISADDVAENKCVPVWSASGNGNSGDSIDDFFASGDQPLVCTFGSGMMHSESRFREVIQMCRQQGWRCLLIGPDTDHLRPHLPADIRAFRYIPFETYLPQCRAIIHHGGIGTIAESIRAGIPQLIMPMTFDQPDNACRIQSLGLGDTIWPRHFKAPVIAESLKRILASEAIAQSCKRHAEKVRHGDGIQAACDYLLRFNRNSQTDFFE